MNFNISAPGQWIQTGVPALVLAPMEGVTDAPMRALLSEIGGFDYGVAEFLRISTSVPGVKAVRRHVPELMHGGATSSGMPVQVQLLGGDPDKLARAALVCIDAGARAVDLNFGCPAKCVNQHDGGALLLLHPERIQRIVSTVRAAVPAEYPVSAKLRLGWDDMRAIHVNAERAADAGASWLTIHARTKTQGYRPPAYWKPIREVRARLEIPVVANGEIWSLGDLRRCRDETGCEHFMLGRGALADPTLASAAARELNCADAELRFTKTPGEWLPFLQRFAVLGLEFGLGRNYIAARIKQWLRLANHDGRLPWFEAVKGRIDLDELLDSIRSLAIAGCEHGGQDYFGRAEEAPDARTACLAGLPR